MYKSYELLFVLRSFLPLDLTRSIIQIYSSFSYKPGQFVFESPCGHILRREKDYDQTYAYVKITTMSSRYDLSDLVECTGKDFNEYYYPDVDCEKCDRQWTTTFEETDLKWKFVCFCKEICSEFPCSVCSTQYVECGIPDCERMASITSTPTLCKKHLQCKICESPFQFYHSRPCCDGCCDGWIECLCHTCKKEFERYEDTPGLLELLF
jgi:hypothetical protein